MQINLNICFAALHSLVGSNMTRDTLSCIGHREHDADTQEAPDRSGIVINANTHWLSPFSTALLWDLWEGGSGNNRLNLQLNSMRELESRGISSLEPSTCDSIRSSVVVCDQRACEHLPGINSCPLVPLELPHLIPSHESDSGNESQDPYTLFQSKNTIVWIVIQDKFIAVNDP